MTQPENKMKYTYPEVLWAGTEHSLNIAVEVHNAMMSGIYDNQEPNDKPEAPYLFSLQGDIGVISIRGSLVNNDSPWNQYRGVTSYSDIRKAMVHAANDPAVKAVLLDIESGGGAVSGVADTADLIANVNANVKPVYAFTDGMMASAAYWLGSSAGQVFTSKTALMGSIGVITTHMEVSKMLKDQGVGVTVLRAGEHKALANQFEPLTKKAMEQIQAQLDGTYQVFINHIADARGTSAEVVDKVMAQGREFLGADAVTAGLADGVTTFDALMSKIEQKIIDTSAKKEQTRFSFQQGTQMKNALTEQQVAAIAAGAPLLTQVVEPTAAETEAAAAEAAALEASAAEAAAAEAAVAATAALEAAKPAAPDAVVTLLQSQLREAQASVVALTVENTSLKSKAAAVEATHEALVKIAGASLSNMKVALGFSGFDASKLKAEELVLEHTSTVETFQTKFKAGGIAATQADETQEPKLNPRFAAILQANRYTPK